MNAFQYEGNSAVFKLLEYLKKSHNEILYRWIDDLRYIQNKDINDSQLCWKTVKNSFQKLFLILGKIYDCF